MRTLIDGYNLMFAGGLVGRKLGPDGFRKVRHRFLNDLADALGPVESHLTTVVFDAVDAPPNLAHTARHKGLTVVYAVESESADERIEELIVGHRSPKTLTVVSSDHRIRRAATRRRARVMTADEYWCQMDDRKDRRKAPDPPEDRARAEGPDAVEAAFWLEEFRELAESDEAREVARGDPWFPTDEELARIAREVEEEFRR